MLSEDDIKYNYDNNGNLIKKQSTEEISDYIYNAEGKLAEVNKTTKAGVETEKYKYNSVGTRIQKTTNGKEINYLVDENTDYSRVLEEKDNTGKLVVSYTYGHDLISQNRENNISLYYKDGLGSTTALGNVTGEVTDTYVYDAFGNIIEKTGTTENSYLFAGEQLDQGTGQYYLRARYMDPTTGRFTTMDSYLGRIQDPTSLHKYLYAHANPVNFTDPSGYFTLNELVTSMKMQAELRGIQITNLYIRMQSTPGGRFVLELSMELIESSLDGALTPDEIAIALFNAALESMPGDQPEIHKPKNSPNPKKWLDNGGNISIDNDGVWTYIHADGHSVKYTDGFPDFKSAGLVKQEVDIGGFNSYYDDFNKADKLAPNGPRDAINNTWHHNQDGKTMQEVNKEIHKDYTHRGGMSIKKKK